MPSHFVLASGSPRRLALLQQIGEVPDLVVPAGIDESPICNEKPADMAVRLAVHKAKATAVENPNAVILGADTVVACGRRVLPKVQEAREARRCLELLSGRRHKVHGGIAIVVASGILWRRQITTTVKFKRLTKKDIDAYVDCGEWQGKAGGYAIQGRAAVFVSAIRGSYTNVVGLCVYATASLLEAARASY
ncbi:MAG: septum formation protein Maf [Candidatus Marinimicrobia bacterium]|nr:septum formation protein Maf [Candidatus Neomarinimicrobiota bacterium]